MTHYLHEQQHQQQQQRQQYQQQQQQQHHRSTAREWQPCQANGTAVGIRLQQKSRNTPGKQPRHIHADGGGRIFDSRHANNQKAVLWSNLGWGAYVTLQAPTWPSTLHGMCSGMITKALRTAEITSAQMRILRWASVAGVPWDWEATASALCHCCGHCYLSMAAACFGYMRC
jgi:hypothetical protein